MARKTPQTIIVIPPDGGGPVQTEVLPLGDKERLKRLQELVGGYIEGVPCCSWQERSLEVYVNEDGIGLNLPTNGRATQLVDLTQVSVLPIGIQGPMLIVKVSGRLITEELAAEMVTSLNGTTVS